MIDRGHSPRNAENQKREKEIKDLEIDKLKQELDTIKENLVTYLSKSKLGVIFSVSGHKGEKRGGKGGRRGRGERRLGTRYSFCFSSNF